MTHFASFAASAFKAISTFNNNAFLGIRQMFVIFFTILHKIYLDSRSNLRIPFVVCAIVILYLDYYAPREAY